MVIVACKCLNITTTIADNDTDLTTTKPFSPPNGAPATAASASGAAATAPHTVEFLKEAVGPFTNPTNLRIETKHDELTGTRRLQITANGANAAAQPWVLVNCLNCDQPVYATRTTAPAVPAAPARKSISSIDDASAASPRNDEFAVVFNGKLLTTLAAINSLKADESYSKIYKVIIRQRSSTILSMLSSTSPPKVAAAAAADSPDSGHLINSTDPRLKNLTSLLGERLRKETESTEERIRQFTADQFVALKLFRQAAEAEYVHLAQKLLAEPAQQPPNELLLADAANKKLISISVVGGMLLETPPLTPDSGTMTMGNSPPRLLSSGSARSLAPIMNSSSAGGGVGGLKMAGRFNALRKRNSDAGPTSASGVGFDDDDDFFGMDGYFPGNSSAGGSGGLGQAQPMSDFDEDFDEEDDLEVTKESGRHIPMRSDYLGQSAGAMMIAKSLPMPTPALPIRAHPDDSDEGLDDNVDIAASIKALAKSVHRSDEVFGDLPRPRLRTKI